MRCLCAMARTHASVYLGTVKQAAGLQPNCSIATTHRFQQTVWSRSMHTVHVSCFLLHACVETGLSGGSCLHAGLSGFSPSGQGRSSSVCTAGLLFIQLVSRTVRLQACLDSVGPRFLAEVPFNPTEVPFNPIPRCHSVGPTTGTCLAFTLLLLHTCVCYHPCLMLHVLKPPL